MVIFEGGSNTKSERALLSNFARKCRYAWNTQLQRKKSFIINVNVQVSPYSHGHKFLPGYYLCSTFLAAWVMLMAQSFLNISVRHLYRQYVDTLLGSAATGPEAWNSTQWQRVSTSQMQVWNWISLLSKLICNIYLIIRCNLKK